MDENASQLESSSREEKLPAWCNRVGDGAQRHEKREAWESYSRGYGVPSSENGPDSTSAERSCTSPVPFESPQGRNSKEEQVSKVWLHPSNEAQFDVSGVPALTLPYYLTGMMNQVMMPLSAQLYQRNLHDVPKHTTSAMVPQYNYLLQCPPHLPVMMPFPYYPASIYLQPGQMPASHPWPSIGTSSSIEVKTGQVKRREAAVIKFRQKRKD